MILWVEIEDGEADAMEVAMKLGNAYPTATIHVADPDRPGGFASIYREAE